MKIQYKLKYSPISFFLYSTTAIFQEKIPTQVFVGNLSIKFIVYYLIVLSLRRCLWFVVCRDARRAWVLCVLIVANTATTFIIEITYAWYLGHILHISQIELYSECCTNIESCYAR
ncbi:unnamed protein product [Meganyctiphanes norvegica]|uniref:Uncharacterized protein n=1 Tax=Meganyctiphanes norvegica TaxID=48144 RepID=A0AAV2QA65_MEGNR